MTCAEVQPFLEAHADGELDLVRQIALDEHLRACPECARQFRGLVERRTALRDTLPRWTAPAALRTRVLNDVRAETRATPARIAGWYGYWGGLAAALVAALAVGYTWGGARARSSALRHEAIADHIRSLQVGHLMDVVSTDQHTVKPWFIGKLDFSPPVVDLADRGFPLAGGRLERLDGRTAAALVFHRRLHSINLFVWPATTRPVPTGPGEENGYHVAGWTQNGLNFLAVSEIPADELDQFVQEYRRRSS
jgi:anti-sigma factor RsiW